MVCFAVQISGLLGHAARGDKKSPAVADNEVGMGGTCQWKLCGLDFDTTVAVLFEITGSGQSSGEQGQVSLTPHNLIALALLVLTYYGYETALVWGHSGRAILDQSSGQQTVS